MTEYRFGDICKVINGRAYRQPELLDAGKYPVLRVGNFFSSDRWFYSDLELPEDKYCDNGDLLFAWSASFGPRIWDGGKVIYHYHIWKLEPNETIVDKYYLYYWLRKSVDILTAGTHGSVMAHMTKGDMENQRILLPCVEEQRKVGKILRLLDDKIKVNSKINDNLYDLLQSVYQLQFGVTSGNAAEGILSDICSYTKDRIAVSELSLGNYYSTENMLPGKAGFTEATSLPTTPQTTRCNAGDVLVSNIRPYFKKIVLCHSEGGCSTDVLCFAPKAPAYSAYLFCTLYADRFFDFMMAGSKGTKMPRGDKQQIMTYPIYIPTESELTAFADFATPILSQIHGNNEENARLEHLRDTLLPKLMSGEIDVSDIDI